MKRLLLLSALLALCLPFSARAADGPTVESVIAVDENTKPTDTFSATTPQLVAFFRSSGTHKGDKLHGVWIADDVGDAAPKGTKIDEASMDADIDDFHGGFTLSKPTAGWPVGSYHIDIYLNDTLATTVKFTITASAPAAAPSGG